MKKLILSLLAAVYATVALAQTNVQKGSGNVLSNGSLVVGNATSITATGNGTIVATSAGNATTVPWSGVTGTPTTLTGYGVTNTLSTTAPLTGGGLLASGLTLAMPPATTSVSGYLTSTDWTTFNSKQAALTFSAPLNLSGSTVSIPAATTSVNGYLTSADWTTFNGKQPAGNYLTSLTGDGTASGPGSAALTLATVNSNVGSFAGLTINGKGLVTAAGNLTLSTTAPLTGGGTLGNLTFAMPPATTSANGYLTFADWNTFNGKQAAGNYITALNGDATASGPGNATLTLATVNSNVGTFGNATNVGSFTVDAKGRITAASNIAISASGNATLSSITGAGNGFVYGNTTNGSTFTLAQIPPVQPVANAPSTAVGLGLRPMYYGIPGTLSKLSQIFNGVSGVKARINQQGDSVGGFPLVTAMPRLVALYGFGGAIGQSFLGYTPSGGVTTVNPNTDYTKWITGGYFSVPNTESIVIVTDTSNQYYSNYPNVPAMTTTKVKSIAIGGGGTYKVQTSAPGANVWTDVQTGIVAPADGNCTITNTTVTSGVYDVRLLVTSGTVKFPIGCPAGFFNGSAGVIINSALSQSGTTLIGYASAPAAQWTAMFGDADLCPDMIVTTFKDAIPDIAAFNAALATAHGYYRQGNALVDEVWPGIYNSAQDDGLGTSYGTDSLYRQNRLVQAFCAANGAIYWDGASFATDFSTAAALGYTNGPGAFINGGAGTGAKAYVNITGSAVASLTLISGGSGYTSPPTVTIVAPQNGSGASVTANISGGAVTSFTVGAGGTGYINDTAHWSQIGNDAVGSVFIRDFNLDSTLRLGSSNALGTLTNGAAHQAGSISTWGATLLTVANGGTGTSNGSITGTGNLTFTSGGSGFVKLITATGNTSLKLNTSIAGNAVEMTTTANTQPILGILLPATYNTSHIVSYDSSNNPLWQFSQNSLTNTDASSTVLNSTGGFIWRRAGVNQFFQQSGNGTLEFADGFTLKASTSNGLTIGGATNQVVKFGTTPSTATAGTTYAVKSGSNALSGTVTLASGAGTISSTAIDANTVIVFTLKTASGTFAQQPYVATITPGTGCTVASTVTDNSTYNWTALKVN